MYDVALSPTRTFSVRSEAWYDEGRMDTFAVDISRVSVGAIVWLGDTSMFGDSTYCNMQRHGWYAFFGRGRNLPTSIVMENAVVDSPSSTGRDVHLLYWTFPVTWVERILVVGSRFDGMSDLF